jgi:hypothetical protein
MAMVGGTEERNQPMKFGVRLLIKHPTMAPIKITEQLDMSPNVSRLAGQVRATPEGAALDGVYGVSVWSWWVQVDGLRYFFQEVTRLLSKIELQSQFLSQLVDTGGSIDVIVELPGDVNIGDVIRWPDLARLASLKANLGIEVFPRFN